MSSTRRIFSRKVISIPYRNPRSRYSRGGLLEGPRRVGRDFRSEVLSRDTIRALSARAWRPEADKSLPRCFAACAFLIKLSHSEKSTPRENEQCEGRGDAFVAEKRPEKSRRAEI